MKTYRAGIPLHLESSRTQTWRRNRWAASTRPTCNTAKSMAACLASPPHCPSIGWTRVNPIQRKEAFERRGPYLRQSHLVTKPLHRAGGAHPRRQRAPRHGAGELRRAHDDEVRARRRLRHCHHGVLRHRLRRRPARVAGRALRLLPVCERRVMRPPPTVRKRLGISVLAKSGTIQSRFGDVVTEERNGGNRRRFRYHSI